MPNIKGIRGPGSFKGARIRQAGDPLKTGSAHIEREVKLHILNADLFRQITDRIISLKSLAGLRAGTPDIKVQTDKYYDSRNLGFYNLRLGTLRLRESKGEYKITLKQPGGKKGKAFERLEFEESISEEDFPKLNTHGCFEKAKKILGVTELVPILTVITQRTTILFGSRKQGIEVALDRVHYREPQAGRETNEEFELEIENKGLSPDRFNKVMEKLNKLLRPFKLEKSEGAKYERGVKRLNLGGGN